MNPRYMIGDEVISKVGGPRMMVSVVTIQNVHAIAFGVNNNGQMQQQPLYTCMWWDHEAASFKQWNFYETMLNDAPVN